MVATAVFPPIYLSADGRRIAAAKNGGRSDISNEFGNTWATAADALGWRSVASSSDGRKLVAVAENPPIYTSDHFWRHLDDP